VYYREAADSSEPEKNILQTQFEIMIRRLLFGITWPSAIFTLSTGIILLTQFPNFPVWLMIKIGFVFLLFLYHLSLQYLFNTQKKGNFSYSSQRLRIWNEVPTLLLVSIVFLVVVKENLSFVYGLAGILALGLGIFTGIKIYKNLRN
jgi:putative membrane protein